MHQMKRKSTVPTAWKVRRTMNLLETMSGKHKLVETASRLKMNPKTIEKLEKAHIQQSISLPVFNILKMKRKTVRTEQVIDFLRSQGFKEKEIARAFEEACFPQTAASIRKEIKRSRKNRNPASNNHEKQLPLFQGNFSLLKKPKGKKA